LKAVNLVKIAQKIIAERMHLDYFSRIYGTVIFRRDKDEISENEIDQIQRALISNGIYSQLQPSSKEYLLRVIAEYSKVRTENRRVNLLLILATFLTTTLTGSTFQFKDPFLSFSNLILGLPYAVAIMTILGAHEMGHYFYAIKHKIYATLPYFIPFYIPVFSFGTFGAFIRIKSPIPNRVALFDVGIAGPIAGLIASIFFIVFGFSQLPDAEGMRTYIETMHAWSETGQDALTLGNSILFDFIRTAMGAKYLPMYEVYHFPFIFAGWIGLLVTALNLMPIGQLDGGHISYALLGKKAKIVAVSAFIALALLNFYSTNWLLWTILILFVIRLKHPPTMNDQLELDTGRRTLAWCSYLIFITCFSPMPIYFS
jgi:membrane-associated protease RseP (regulator of RpoE activity)